MRLFTPVSAEEADQLERDVPLDGPVYWTDRPVSEEATGLGYREFELPPGIPAMFPVERLGLADCLGGRERPSSDLSVRRSAGMRRYPRVTASTRGWLSHRAHSGHGESRDGQLGNWTDCDRVRC